MKKLFSIALILLLSITFVSATQGVSSEIKKEITHYSTLTDYSNSDIVAVNLVEFDSTLNFVFSNSSYFVSIDTLTTVPIVIEYDKLKTIAAKHLRKKTNNPIIAIYFPDSYCLNLDTVSTIQLVDKELVFANIWPYKPYLSSYLTSFKCVSGLEHFIGTINNSKTITFSYC